MKAIVVGAGLDGLSAAVRLAAGGVQVQLLCPDEAVGAQLRPIELAQDHHGKDWRYEFAPGAECLTLPFVLLDLFAAAGRDVRDFLAITRLEPLARYRWPDGRRFDLSSDDSTLIRQIGQFAGPSAGAEEAGGWLQVLERGRRVWQVAEPLLTRGAEQFVENIRCAGPLAAAGALTLPFRIGLLERYERLVNRHVCNPALRQVLRHRLSLAGADPRRAPGMLAVLVWIEHYFGCWRVVGGMYRLVRQLELLALQLGVAIRRQASIERIITRDAHGKRSACGVGLRDGTELFAQAIILASSTGQATSTGQLRDRGSTALLLRAKGIYEELADVNYLLAAEREVCVYARTCGDSATLPRECQSLMVTSRPATTPSELIDDLEHRWGLRGLRRRIVVEQTAGLHEDRTICNDLRCWLSSPPRRDRDVRGLYHSVGHLPFIAGVSGAVLSGVRIAECLLQDHSRHNARGADRIGNALGLGAGI